MQEVFIHLLSNLSHLCISVFQGYFTFPEVQIVIFQSISTHSYIKFRFSLKSCSQCYISLYISFRKHTYYTYVYPSLQDISMCKFYFSGSFPEVLNHHFSTIFHSLLLNLRFSLQSYSWYNFRKLLSAHHFRLFPSYVIHISPQKFTISKCVCIKLFRLCRPGSNTQRRGSPTQRGSWRH